MSAAAFAHRVTTSSMFALLLVFGLAVHGSHAGDSPGRRIVVLGPGGASGLACVACHGLDGAPDAAKGIPRLAGEARTYLAKQLRDYAAGTRRDPAMNAVAAQLSPEDVIDVSAYYSLLTPPSHEPVTIEPDVQERSALIDAFGDRKRDLPACVDCHAYADASRAGFPKLFGQPAEYLERQLFAWRKGNRGNDPLGIMQRVSARLTDSEIHDLARYFSALPHPQASTKAEPMSARERLFARRR